ncbi:MAG: hypothetical protein JSS04_05865 [Proteobacteria bacterium]|nr:hypothetical protein [Pseudomonadota bacterium]
MSAHHRFEYGSPALNSVMALAVVSGGLGLPGVVFGALGFFAPTLLHL